MFKQATVFRTLPARRSSASRARRVTAAGSSGGGFFSMLARLDAASGRLQKSRARR